MSIFVLLHLECFYSTMTGKQDLYFKYNKYIYKDYDVFKNILPDHEYTFVEQNLTICLASRSIVPENTSLIEEPLYKHIAISVIPSNTNEFVKVLIFSQLEEKYIPFGWLQYVPLQPSIDDELFKQDPPTSKMNKIELCGIFLQKADTLIRK